MEALANNWIWISKWEEIKNDRPILVEFKKTFVHAEKIKISANSRYKLYINGVFVQEGPQKGDAEAAYVDTCDISNYLKNKEKNEALVKVLYYPESPGRRNESLYYSPYPCLYIEDLGETQELSGFKGWETRVASEVTFASEPFFPAPIFGSEIYLNDQAKSVQTKAEKWRPAKPYTFFERDMDMAPFQMLPRTIPAMQHSSGKFSNVVCLRDENEKVLVENSMKESWRQLIELGKTVVIPANSTQTVELSAGEETCAYPIISFSAGSGAKLTITYSECYAIPQPPEKTSFGERPVPPLKGDREDFWKGCLSGAADIYNVIGCGTKEAPEVYEPYLFRTFRFVQLKIETKEEALGILSYDFLKTGYPLEIKRHPVSNREDYNKIWEMSLRTLRRCMHETYVDCPFYEQLQYAMDTRAEILFTYELSDDDRLARAAMEAFRRSQRKDGMINSCAPSASFNGIPGFAIFYIMMVHDHYKRYKDKSLVKQHFTAIDNIINYFDANLIEMGLVGNVGGKLFEHKYWSFVDWCEAWNDSIGMPLAKFEGTGCLTYESLLYLYGLGIAGELAATLERYDMQKEYTKKYEALKSAILLNCMDENMLLLDGPGVKMYSTQCQVWGVLNHLFTKEEGRNAIEKTYGVEGIPQCSVSMSFYLLEAMDMLGMLDKYDSVWDPWRKMLDNHLTTCIENTTDERSDCHAWGAIMLYALPNYYQ